MLRYTVRNPVSLCNRFLLADFQFYIAGSATSLREIVQNARWKYTEVHKGITVLKIVIWGGESSVLWSQIAFYEISDLKTNDSPPQITILKTVIP